jgi:hypothetical protein
MKIQRVANIDQHEFLSKFLLKNQPVIIADGMQSWDMEKFRPGHLRKTFGDQLVQVYNDLFDLQDVYTLEQYFSEYFDKDGDCKYYVRWYSKLKDKEFFWSDEVFASMNQYWQHPYFLPESPMLVPYVKEGEPYPVTDKGYPYRGLFISAKGARTRLHKDPFNSNAILCQFYGEKEMILYSPGKFPDLSTDSPAFEDVLMPGEIVLFPAGWFHDVTCLSNSISITWNFVHSDEKDGFVDFVKEHPDDDQLEIAAYFLGGEFHTIKSTTNA